MKRHTGDQRVIQELLMKILNLVNQIEAARLTGEETKYLELELESTRALYNAVLK